MEQNVCMSVSDAKFILHIHLREGQIVLAGIIYVHLGPHQLPKWIVK